MQRLPYQDGMRQFEHRLVSGLSGERYAWELVEHPSQG